jgi:hypothetical protein
MYGFDLVTEGISAAFWCSLWAATWAITLYAAPESNPDWMLFVAGTPLIYSHYVRLFTFGSTKSDGWIE